MLKSLGLAGWEVFLTLPIFGKCYPFHFPVSLIFIVAKFVTFIQLVIAGW